MSEVFISYARSTEEQARRIADALRALGYGVWRDDELPAHRAYADVIEERLNLAKAVVVVWSAEAARSEWVRSEAERARADRKLVQLTLDRAKLPMPFDQIQCADLSEWRGEAGHRAWVKVLASIAELHGAPRETLPTPTSIAPALPDKPSIAVLPFADPSGALEGDYFADGMVDEIVAALARFPALFVIASGSSFCYRERERDFRKIGRELGVRHLLEGSVRRSGGQVRIAADLVEAETGAQVWTERFEGALTDVFALQDEVANAVAARIEPTIQGADLRRGQTRPTEDLNAYDLYLRALERFRAFDRQGLEDSVSLCEQAVERDPGFAEAWAHIAAGQAQTLFTGWFSDRAETVRQTQEAIRQAIKTGGDNAEALATAAFAQVVLAGEHRSAQVMADRALSLNPGAAIVWTYAGFVSQWGGRYEQALERFQRALRLNPCAPDRHAVVLGIGIVLSNLERCEEALSWLNEALVLRPNYPGALFQQVIAFSHLGRIEEAKTALARFEALGSLKAIAEMVMRGPWAESYRQAFERLGVEI